MKMTHKMFLKNLR